MVTPFQFFLMTLPITLPVLLFTGAAFAQPPQPQPQVPPPIRALDTMLHQATEREALATVQAAQLRAQVEDMAGQIEALTKARDELTKERDALKTSALDLTKERDALKAAATPAPTPEQAK